jgi:glycosylphosphatidylinositol transamidase (GPIT) subunit GPI8
MKIQISHLFSMAIVVMNSLKCKITWFCTQKILPLLLIWLIKRNKYRRILFLSDTCEAFSWFNYVKAPNIMYQASSGEGESAYSHNFDEELNAYTTDKYSYLLIKYLTNTHPKKGEIASVLSFFESFDRVFMDTSAVYNSTLIDSSLDSEPLINFFPKDPISERFIYKSTQQEHNIAASFINDLSNIQI